MIPKTQLIYSWIYNRELNRDKSAKYVKENFEKLKKNCERFEKIYKKFIRQVLELIPKHTGKAWKKEYILIYIVFTDGSSFHSPLTLKYHKDVKKMLFVLTHELIHNNIEEHGFKAEEKINKYANRVLERLSL